MNRMKRVLTLLKRFLPVDMKSIKKVQMDKQRD